VNTPGYYRFPTIWQDTIVFVAEDDLWTVARSGGMARRLTSNLGEVNYPALSPDGQWLAFVGREEGMTEVYRMPAAGGVAQRMTYLDDRCQVLGWTADSQAILFASPARHFYRGEYAIYRIDRTAENGAIRQVPVGPARAIAFGPAGQVVIGRNTGDPARWKRYRGGTAGHLWIDRQGDGEFVRLLADLAGNLASPLWLETAAGGRVFFVSDHEGVGNLYSCAPDGTDLRRATDHADFYVRNPATDGQRIVYHAGADLFVYDPATGRSEVTPVAFHSPRVQRNRKFTPAAAFLDHARLSPIGDALTVTSRGKLFAFFNHEGPVLQLGQRDGVRYRLPDWLNDGRRLVLVDDAAGEEELVIYSAEPGVAPTRLQGLDIGRPVALHVSPTQDKVAISNHRQELLLVDLESRALTVVDRSAWRPIAGFDWAPDGQWLVYSFATALNATEIRLYRLPPPPAEAESPTASEAADVSPADVSPADVASADATPNPIAITRPVLHDVNPVFDPEGKYIYFLSYREFNPVYDSLQFDLSFPWGVRPYLITLHADLPNPFMPRPGGDEQDDEDEDDRDEDHGDHDDERDEDDEHGEEDADADDDADERAGFPANMARRTAGEHAQQAAPAADDDDEAASAKSGGGKKSGKDQRPRAVEIDLEEIERRVIAFPVQDGRFSQIGAAPGRTLFTSMELEGTLDHLGETEHDEESGELRAWVFKDYKAETIAEGVSEFALARNHKKLLYFNGNRLRVISATEKAPGNSGPGRKSGWVDLARVRVSVMPPSEWEQMYREAWRLQRDHFWREDMAEIDWQAVYNRYLPLLERVGTRSEFSDLVWEMQGELGTSHAYEFGGDYRPSPHYSQGVLAADFTWSEAEGGYRIDNIVLGDPWNRRATSPLRGPGVDVRAGDVLLAINGQRLSASLSPEQLLVNQADAEILLTLAPRPPATDAPAAEPSAASTPDAAEAAPAEPPPPRNVVVQTLYGDSEARYRAWVEGNRRRVHEASGGRLGYLHIPDMGAHGYAEFHRGFLAEVERDGLIVDVRYNGGGHVSQLLLEKLARRRIGYDQSRWGGVAPYPAESVAGPIVALTNEHAGSDGDIFCHAFKLLKLGPLVGKRTWGGVIGIAPHHPLVDGTITTQPEFSFWFEDVGWQVENYGTDPDIEVEMAPQDYVAGRDVQLARAIAEALQLLAEQPVRRPDPATRPSRALPKLPPRS
jgi:tricorn protease